MKVLVIIGICFVTSIFAQQNHAINGGFESLISCPTFMAQLHLAYGWDTLRAGGGGSPELYARCCSDPIWCGVPTNANSLGYQEAKTGNNYGAVACYQNTSYIRREYVQDSLGKNLDAGKTYCVKLYVNLHNSSQYAIDKLGIYFDDGSISTPFAGISTVVPQVESSGAFLNDTLMWVPISGTFISNGTEKFMTIGNFHSNSQTNIQNFNPSSQSLIAYYNIDDVSVIDFNLPAFAGNDTTVTIGDSVYIGRPFEIGLENEWYNSFNTLVGSGAGIWIHPNQDTTYIVKQNLCGNITTDTIHINVIPNSIQKFEQLSPYRIFPNPSNGKVTIENIEGSSIGSISIADLSGHTMFTTTENINSSFIEINHVLEPGIYLLTVVSDVTVKRITFKMIVLR